MKYLKYVGFVAVLLLVAGTASAQVAVRVGVGPGYVVGPPPACPYGYYGYYPYTCAPYGYYGPGYFVNGIFIGAGPWFHGYYGGGLYDRGYYGHGFYGRPGYGYRGGWGNGYRGEIRAGRGYAHAGGGYYGGRAFHGGSGYHGGGGFHGGRR
jgi:hypothetical protein